MLDWLDEIAGFVLAFKGRAERGGGDPKLPERQESQQKEEAAHGKPLLYQDRIACTPFVATSYLANTRLPDSSPLPRDSHRYSGRRELMSLVEEAFEFVPEADKEKYYRKRTRPEERETSVSIDWGHMRLKVLAARVSLYTGTAYQSYDLDFVTHASL